MLPTRVLNISVREMGREKGSGPGFLTSENMEFPEVRKHSQGDRLRSIFSLSALSLAILSELRWQPSDAYSNSPESICGLADLERRSLGYFCSYLLVQPSGIVSEDHGFMGSSGN